MDSVQPGQTIGPYSILNQVGQGGMATVYRAYHSAMDRYVAVKILPRQLAESPEFTGRFRQEARTIARLEHAHILPVHDYGESDGYTYLVMRYLEAGTLKDRLQQAPLPLREVDRLFTQLADALDYAHAQGVIHRDLKPSNVLLDARQNVFLTDFGIAKLLQGDANFTSTGAMIGTPAYMSPEQAQGTPVDQRSDLYSLGIILYEMVTGRVPFEADTPLAVILKHVNEPLPLPSRVKPGLPSSIEKVLLKALAKDPAERYPTTTAFVEAWKAALQAPNDATLADDGTQFVPPAPPAPLRQPTAQAAAPARPAPPVPPAGRRLGLLGPLGIVGALGALVCGGSLCAFLVYNQFFSPGAPGLPLPGVTQPGGRGGTPSPEPTPLLLGTVLAPVDGTPALEATEPPESAPSGTWQSWTAANEIFAVTFYNGKLFTGGPGGMTGWDPSTGAVTDRFTTGEGLPGVYITALVADPDSDTLLIGTDNGLLQFTGDEVRLHDSETGLDGSFIGAVAVTDDGLLVGTGNSGLPGGGLQQQVGEDEWEPVADFPSDDPEISPEALSSEVTALVVDPDTEQLWVGTANGLGLYDGSDWTRFAEDDGLPAAYITSLALVEGTLLAGTDSGLAVYNGSGFDAVPEVTFTPVYSIVPASDGQLWVSGGGGVARRSPDGEWTLWDYLALPSYSIYGGVEGDDGIIYFGTEVGVLTFDGDDYTGWTAPNVPVNAAFARIVPAPSTEQLWFVEEYGTRIDIYEPAKEAWVAGPELACSSCAPLAWDENGHLWAASELGLWIFDGEDEEAPYTTEQGLPSDEVRAVAIGPEGTAWVATAGGLAVYDNGDIATVYDASNSGLASDAVHALLLAADQSLWAATEANLSRLMPDGTWVHYGLDNPFITDLYISDLAEDASGDIWATTIGDGVYRYRAAEDTWERYSPLVQGVDLPWNELNCIAVAPDGTVWVGAPYAGAARFDGEHWEVFEVGDGLIHSNVNDIYVSGDGVVWFATSGGVTRLEP